MSGMESGSVTAFLVRVSFWLALATGLAAGVASLLGFLGRVKALKKFSLASLAGMWVLQFLLAGAVGTRWLEVGHQPWQTLYEVLLLVSAFLVFSYLLVRFALREFRSTRISAAIFDFFTALTAGTAALLLFIGMGKDDSASVLPPALKSYWMAPHVVAYTFAYATLAIACVAVVTWWVVSFLQKTRGGRVSEETARWLGDFDRFAYAIVAVGFPFLTAALLMGSLWGQGAWGSYWGWDSKEVAALISWIIYVIYLHLRLVARWRGGKLYSVLFIGALSIAVCFLLFSYLPASFSSLHKYAG